MFDVGPALALHANGMKLFAFDADGKFLLVDNDLSIGSGFLMTDAKLKASIEALASDLGNERKSRGYPYPFVSAAKMLALGAQSGLIIAKDATHQRRSGHGTAAVDPSSGVHLASNG